MSVIPKAPLVVSYSSGLKHIPEYSQGAELNTTLKKCKTGLIVCPLRDAYSKPSPIRGI
jgi:hypothetical protein